MHDLLANIKSEWISETRVLYQEGDDPDFVYFILEGEVSISVRRPDEQEHEIARLQENQILGDIAALSEEKRSTKATVTKQTLLLKAGSAIF